MLGTLLASVKVLAGNRTQLRRPATEQAWARLENHLYEFARAAITQYHELRGLTADIVSRFRKSQIEVGSF